MKNRMEEVVGKLKLSENWRSHRHT